RTGKGRQGMSGQGHVRKRGKGSWEIKFDLGTNPVTGKRETRYHSFKGSRKEARAELVRSSAEAIKGVYVDASGETISQFLDGWDRDFASHHVSLKTIERYRQLIANQIKPHLGAMPVQKVKPIHLNALYSKLKESGGIDGAPLAALTVGHVHRLLRRVFGHAVQWGVIIQNPAAVVHPTRVQQGEIEIIREDEIKLVLNTLRSRNLPLYTIATVALATGLRRGELIALRWKDIDLDGGKLRVEQSLEQTKAGLRFKPPKSKHGRRTITIPPAVVADLRAHWKATQEQRLTFGIGRSTSTDLVFTMWDGSPRKPKALTNEWLRASLGTGRAINLHAL